MDTLKSLRIHEKIKTVNVCIMNTACVTTELQERNGEILYFIDHSDEVVSIVLREIDPSESGYIFFASEINLDPINNNMVPKHRMATDIEKQTLVDRHIPFNTLPILRMLDPVRRWHNFPQDSIIAIERENGNYFRRVF